MPYLRTFALLMREKKSFFHVPRNSLPQTSGKRKALTKTNTLVFQWLRETLFLPYIWKIILYNSFVHWGVGKQINCNLFKREKIVVYSRTISSLRADVYKLSWLRWMHHHFILLSLLEFSLQLRKNVDIYQNSTNSIFYPFVYKPCFSFSS